jgi:hypothetical protein
MQNQYSKFDTEHLIKINGNDLEYCIFVHLKKYNLIYRF